MSDFDGLWRGTHCVCPDGADECTCGAAEGNGPCSDPGGHEWSEGEADRGGEGPIRCIHCGADGDA